MKRIKAWFLVAILVISLAMSLVGCNAAGADSALTMGQWLSMLADSFGMATYTEQEPFFKKVSAESSYFSAFQACAEWEIIEPSDTVDEKTPLTWNDVLITLVNAGAFTEATASDKEKIDYAIAHFDSSIRTYWGGRYIKMSDAVVLLETAVDQWVNFRYEETLEVLAVTDDVKDFLDTEVEYTLDEANDVITVEGDVLANLKPGDVYTLPGNDWTNASINKVGSIEVVDGKTVIVNDDTFTQEEALEYIEEYQYEDSSPVDFGRLGGLYDEEGNPIDFTVNPEEDLLADMGIGDGACVTPLTANSADSIEADQLGFFDHVKGTLEFKVKDKNHEDVNWIVKITIKKSSIAVKLSRERTIEKSETSQELYAQVGFSNVQLTRDVDISWGKLKSATMKMSYETTIEAGVAHKTATEIGKENKIPDSLEKFKESGVKDVKEAISQYKNALSDATEPWRIGNKKKDSVYICRLNILGSSTAAGVDFIVKGEVTVTGEVKIVITLSGAAGIEYKKDKIRYIKKNTTDVDFMADAKVEATLVPGFEVRVLKKILVIDLLFPLGAGASFTINTHLLDKEGHRLYSAEASLSGEAAEAFADYGDIVLTKSELKDYLIDQGIQWDPTEDSPEEITFGMGFCFDFRIYPIFRINAGSKASLVGKLLSKASLEFEYEVLGEDNVILGGHIDFSQGSNPVELKLTLFGKQKCTLENTPWPTDDRFTEEDPTEPETTVNNDYAVTDRIALDTVRFFMDVGEVQYLNITELPTGYTLDDLEIVIEDRKVVDFDEDFAKLVAVGEGTTQVIIRTKDKKHKLDLAFTVSSKSAENGNKSNTFSHTGKNSGTY